MRAALVKHPQQWPWSSYRALVGQIAAPDWLDVARVHGQLLGRDADTAGSAAQRYAHFVAQGVSHRLWDGTLRGQVFLGDEGFMQRMQAKLQPDARANVQIPREQRQPPAASIDVIRARHLKRNEALTECARHGHSLSAIARQFGLSVSRVSRLVAKGKT